VSLAAKRKKLDVEDCWRHGPEPKVMMERFDVLWAIELKKKKPSIIRTIWALSKGDFAFGAFCWAIAQACQVVQPIFLMQVVRFVEVYRQFGHGDDCRADADPADRHLCNPVTAYLIPALFIVTQILMSLLQTRSQMINMKMALQFRQICVCAIFRKSMRLNSIGAVSGSAGMVNNLVSNDSQQILHFAPMMHFAWTAPLFIIASFIMLSYAVGPVFLVGVGVVFVLLPYTLGTLRKAIKLRGEMVQFTDKRVKLINDVLMGLRVIKSYGWETAVMDKVKDARKDELKWNARRGLWQSFLIVGVFLSPVLIAIAIFSTYAAFGNELVASTVFMALATLNGMRFALIMGPFLLVQWGNFMIAARRMQAYLELDEVPEAVAARLCAPAFGPDLVGSPAAQAGECCIENASAAWGVATPPPEAVSKRRCCNKKKGKGDEVTEEKDQQSDAGGNCDGKNIVTKTVGEKEVRLTQILFDVNFKADSGMLTAIVGPVGSGKSSLLQCLLGEMEMLTGTIALQGTIAYVAQQAFIINATIKQNITLSRQAQLSPDQEERFNKILFACALEDDLAQLPGGVMTEIGERGVTLSGGQKQRISLARAVYSGADIVVLDDPLSAVDAHVGRHLFQHVIGENGMLTGKTRILVTHQLQFLDKCHQIYMMDEGRIRHSGDYASLTRDGHLDVKQAEEDIESTEQARNRRVSQQLCEPMDKQAGQLVMQEEREEGELKMAVLAAYVRAGGIPLFYIWAFAITLQTASQLCTEAWLASWTSGEGMGVSRDDEFPVGFYIGIYVALGFSQGIFLFTRSIVLQVYHSRYASQLLHDNMLKSVFRARMVFFDQNPLGRVLNRFTRDLEYVDMLLVQSLTQFINTISAATGAIIMICIIYPYFILLALAMAMIYHKFTKYFRHASRELQRLEAVTRSPMFSLLSECQQGVGTIRSYGVSGQMVQFADDATSLNVGVYYMMVTCINWLQVRLDLLMILILVGVSVVPTAMPTLVQPGYVGLALTYAFELGMYMKHSARMGAEMEQKFTAVDRILDYSQNIQPEADLICPKDKSLGLEWPTSGNIRFSDVSLVYRPGLEPALRSVSFEISGGEKVGICGRTGSGKSSLIVTLLRLSEYTGTIEVDGANLQEVGLHTLRQRIAMIPQDPVLFCASLRSNLDPLGLVQGDAELKAALEMVRLADEVDKLGGLNFAVSEGGQNFSVGQRQLLCLSRAILRKSKIVLLDEATASVDPQTDDIIQKTIRNEFHASTVVTIAHRLNTIIDSDRILVLDRGEVSEFGTPQGLAGDESSSFHSLLKSAGGAELVAQAMQQAGPSTIATV
jgi:ABC-type multidrug transport system fused ATPase/permease subunit